MVVVNNFIKGVLVTLLFLNVCKGAELKEQLIIDGEYNVFHLTSCYADRLFIITVEKDTLGIYLKLVEVKDEVKSVYRLENPYFERYRDPNHIGLINLSLTGENLYVSDGNFLMHYEKNNSQYNLIENVFFSVISVRFLRI